MNSDSMTKTILMTLISSALRPLLPTLRIETRIGSFGFGSVEVSRIVLVDFEVGKHQSLNPVMMRVSIPLMRTTDVSRPGVFYSCTVLYKFTKSDGVNLRARREREGRRGTEAGTYPPCSIRES
jgi:hypothetical protein